MTNCKSKNMEYRLQGLRTVVAARYDRYLIQQNGGAWYQSGPDNLRLAVTPDAIALTIRNNIEGALIGEYGTEQGTANALELLSAMLNDDLSVGGLSSLGLSLMNDLFSALAAMVHDADPLGVTWSTAMNQPIH